MTALAFLKATQTACTVSKSLAGSYLVGLETSLLEFGMQGWDCLYILTGFEILINGNRIWLKRFTFPCGRDSFVLAKYNNVKWTQRVTMHTIKKQKHNRDTDLEHPLFSRVSRKWRYIWVFILSFTLDFSRKVKRHIYEVSIASKN